MYYYQDIFYSVGRLPLEVKKQIINDALKVCYEWHVDILDCSKSWARKKIDMPIEEILSKLAECLDKVRQTVSNARTSIASYG